MRTALRLLLNPSDDDYGPWVREIWNTEVVYEFTGKSYKAPYTLTGTDVTIGAPVEVKVAFVPATDSAGALRRVRVDFVAPIHMDPARKDGILATADPVTGFLHLEGRLTRTGVFRYRDAEGNEWGELRTADEVFNQESLDSFKGVVVTNDHPDNFVNVRNVKAVQAGHVGTDVRPEGNFVRASTTVTDAATILAIRDGKTQLSCGYTADMVEDAGELGGQAYAFRQTNIRGNHVAIVDVGRAGPDCALINRGDGSAFSVSPAAKSPAPKGDATSNRPRRDARPQGEIMDPKKLIKDALELVRQGKLDAAKKLLADVAKHFAAKKDDDAAGGEGAGGGKIGEILALLNAAQESGQPLLVEAALSKVGEMLGGSAGAPPAPTPEQASAGVAATPPAATGAPGHDSADALRARVDSLEAERKRDKESEAARIDARVKLVRQASEVSPDLKTDGLTDEQIMREVVLKVSPDLKAKLDANAKSPGYLLASYESALDLHASRGRHMEDTVKTIANVQRGDETKELFKLYMDSLEKRDGGRKVSPGIIRDREDDARRLVRICDAVPRHPMFHADENEGIFARQLVMETLRELFRLEYAELKWAMGDLIPITTNVNEGATEYSYIEVEHSGQAKIIADNATDLPMAEVRGRNNILPVKTLGCAVQFSTQEIRTAQMQGLFDIASEKAQAAREAHDLALNELIRSGMPMAGLYGITNVPGILVHSAVTGAWASATAEQIVTDFSTAHNSIVHNSNGIEVPDTAVFPLVSFTRISTLKNSVSSDITVLDYLKKVHPNITRWEWENGMATVGTGGTRAAQIYKKDPRKVRAVVPMALKPQPAQQRGLVFELVFESRYGGVMAPRPRSELRLEGI